MSVYISYDLILQQHYHVDIILNLYMNIVKHWEIK